LIAFETKQSFGGNGVANRVIGNEKKTGIDFY